MDIANSVYTAYSKGRNAIDLSLVIGEEGLTTEERNHLRFAQKFDNRFIKQGKYERRPVQETLNLGDELLKIVREA
jgi:V/A-type H+-transporting ATPase subunit B